MREITELTGFIIFSRFDSVRLPGKALRKIGGREMLGRVIDRTKALAPRKNIVLATTKLRSDDALEQYAIRNGISVYRGSSGDVVKRAYECVIEHKFERMVRICGDRPFFDPKAIQRCIGLQIEGSYELVTNNLHSRPHPGLVTEVISQSALGRVNALSRDSDEREHLTAYIYKNTKEFSICDITEEIVKNYTKLSVDTELDLRKAEWLISQLGDPVTATAEAIISLAFEWDLSQE